jgi:3-dehydroquinate synthase
VPHTLVVRYPARPRASRIVVARGALAGLGRFVRTLTSATTVALVSDARVLALHGTAARRALARAGVRAVPLIVPRGERAKQPRVLARLWDRMAAARLARADAVVALGGGAIGDVAGFAAATWLRGVPWIGVPTTVLAQVDSSVGGKTGIDLAAGKNLVGAFHQPLGVLADPDTLATLPGRQRRAGLAEVVKAGMIADAALFRSLERDAGALARGDAGALERAIVRAIRAKTRIVQRDERERDGGPRTALNFGHTLGHALEAAHGYRRLLHGEAVAIGMRIAARLSVREAGLPGRELERLEGLLDRLALPRRMPPTSLARLAQAMAHDKKRAGRAVRWVLTPRVGHASVPRLISSRVVRSALLDAGARP